MNRLATLALLGVVLAQGEAGASFLYVADAQAGIIAVDPVTGAQRLVSSGGYLTAPADVALEQNGDLLITNRGTPSLVEVNPVTGQQSLVSSGQYFADPLTLANGPNGTFYIADAGPSGGPGTAGKIIQVNTQGLRIKLHPNCWRRG
jgi:streptogramin lyase